MGVLAGRNCRMLDLCLDRNQCGRKEDMVYEGWCFQNSCFMGYVSRQLQGTFVSSMTPRVWLLMISRGFVSVAVLGSKYNLCELLLIFCGFLSAVWVINLRVDILVMLQVFPSESR